MKRAALVLFALLALSFAQAQTSYVGIRIDVLASQPVAPLIGIHAGEVVFDSLELRVSFSTLLFANFLQADILYTRDLSDTLGIYGGGGGTLAFYLIPQNGDSSNLFVHATAGLEYRSGGGPGLFAEVQPLYTLDNDPRGSYIPGGFLGKLTLGINFYP